MRGRSRTHSSGGWQRFAFFPGEKWRAAKNSRYTTTSVSLISPSHSSVSLADDGSECVIRSNIAGCVYISPSLSLDLAVWKVSAAELQANFGPLGPADRLPADLNPT